MITTFQQGGLDAYKLDIEIPQKYGVEQCVGDTLGPGGVFRALRTIPVLLDLCDEMDELAPRRAAAQLRQPDGRQLLGRGRRHRGGPTSGCATACRAPARCWPGGSTCPTRKSISCAPASTTRPFSSNSAAAKRISIRCLWEAIERAGDLWPGAGAHRHHEVLRLLRHRVERPRQRIHALLPQERQHGQRGARAALHRSSQPLVRLWRAPAATCATACTGWSSSKATIDDDRRGRRVPDQAQPRVRLVHHRGDGDQQAGQGQRRQRAQYAG